MEHNDDIDVRHLLGVVDGDGWSDPEDNTDDDDRNDGNPDEPETPTPKPNGEALVIPAPDAMHSDTRRLIAEWTLAS